MNKLAKTFAIALSAAAALGGAALADTPANKVADASRASAPLTTGSVDVDPPFTQRMADCMAVWDKGTHMTKDQWRRSCRTTLKSLESN